MASEKLPDGSYKATVVGQEHTLVATGSDATEAIRALKRVVHEKFTSGQLGDLKQNMI